MRTREIEKVRRGVVERWRDGLSLRAQAKQMGISHHALRCFVHRANVATSWDTIWKIRDVIENGPWPPEHVEAEVRRALWRLHRFLDLEDIEGVVDVLHRKIEARREQARALKEAHGAA